MSNFDQQARPAALFNSTEIPVRTAGRHATPLHPDTLTRLVLEAIKQPTPRKPAELILVDGEALSVHLDGIECICGMQSVRTVDPRTGRSQLIPYEQIHRMNT